MWQKRIEGVVSLRLESELSKRKTFTGIWLLLRGYSGITLVSIYNHMSIYSHLGFLDRLFDMNILDRWISIIGTKSG